MAPVRRRRRKATRRTEPDRGTPEAQARRYALIGTADPALAEYPLGVLLARGVITGEQHDAGCHYAYLAGRVLGRTKPYRADQGGSGAALNEVAIDAIERRWHQAVRTLLDAGRRAKDEVDNVALFERLPSWVGAESPRLGDARSCEELVAGLEALALWRRGGRKVFAEAAE